MNIFKKMMAIVLVLGINGVSFGYNAPALKEELATIDAFTKELRQENSTESNDIVIFLEKMLENSMDGHNTFSDAEVLKVSRIIESSDTSFKIKKTHLLNIMLEKSKAEMKYKEEERLKYIVNVCINAGLVCFFGLAFRQCYLSQRYLSMENTQKASPDLSAGSDLSTRITNIEKLLKDNDKNNLDRYIKTQWILSDKYEKGTTSEQLIREIHWILNKVHC